MGQHNKFLRAGPDGGFYRLVPESALLTLPVALLGGRLFLGQKILQILLKFRRPSFHAFAFLTFSLVLHFAVLKNGFHLDFPAAGAKELLRRARSTRVFTCLSHGISPCPFRPTNFVLKRYYRLRGDVNGL
jgi:hypothetical protein